MKKLILLASIFAITTVYTGCNQKIDTSDNHSENSSYNESNNQTNDLPETNIEDTPQEKTTDNYTADDNCTFNSDGEVLSYLIGKAFTQDGGGIKIKFNETGALISGLQYQWMTYTSLGGFKGKVKLSSTDPSNPDGTITLYVSCREKSITDGQTVLFLD